MKPATTNPSSWICCQLGAREHYAIPRALHSHGALWSLITDAWVRPGSLLGRHRRSWGERFHSELNGAQVNSCNAALLRFELFAHLRGLTGWTRTMARNRWFQAQTIRHLQSLISAFRPVPSDVTLFAYSYAALDLFRFAKEQGWRTVLGQIDPGLQEERLVQQLFESSNGGLGSWAPAPTGYWQIWREESALADAIVVNSKWSRQGLLDEGVPASKLRILPLAFEGGIPTNGNGFQRNFPDRFSTERPLRVLFLGQINLRKGIGPLFEAVRLLRQELIEFWFVGPVQVRIPNDLADAPNIRWIGPVSRQATASFYRDADVFLFPTLSDGFGLTQLEAQGWRLPVIASRFCGEVVQNGVNGLILNEVTAVRISEALRHCLLHPALLAEFSQSAVEPETFGLKALGNNLLRIKM
jgi:glycosyltransferase involved in cell wall biosynthesis